MTKASEILLALLRQSASPKSSLREETLSFGLKAPEGKDLETLSPADWQELIDLAFSQGVDAIAVDGYAKSPLPTSPIRGGDGLTPSPPGLSPKGLLCRDKPRVVASRDTQSLPPLERGDGLTPSPSPLERGASERGDNRDYYRTADPMLYNIMKGYAEEMRNNPTEAERAMWSMLREKKLNAKFRRQHIIGDYIVDFVCLDKNLIIEIDGEYHNEWEQQIDDAQRTTWLENKGFTLIRFTNDEVLADTDQVLLKIKNVLKVSPNGGDLEGASEGAYSQVSPNGGDLEGAKIALETDESLEDLKFEWFGSVLQAEEDYRKQVEAIASLAKVYSEAGIRMMVLKGYGLSLNYPNPSHRPTGDIDIYLSPLPTSPIRGGDGLTPSPPGLSPSLPNREGAKEDACSQVSPNGGDLEGASGGAPAWKRGDEIIRKMGIKVDEGHEHHTIFSWMGFAVENHYDFVNTKVNGSSRELEREYKRLSADAVPTEVGGATIYLPSAQFNALFLIHHLGQHFAGAKASLRQVLDWGFFVRACHNDVDWSEAMCHYCKAGIDRFVHQINAICVDYLGFDESLFPEIERDITLETRILEDILHPEFAEVKPQGSTLKVVWFKTRRFFANRWKHRLVYRESISSQFLHGSIAHLRRFKTIRD